MFWMGMHVFDLVTSGLTCGDDRRKPFGRYIRDDITILLSITKNPVVRLTTSSRHCAEIPLDLPEERTATLVV
jgi:hypothetical protein